MKSNEPAASASPILDKLVDDIAARDPSINKAVLKELIDSYTTHIAIQARIDELKRLPNTKPVWFDPKIHTNYIDARIAELEGRDKTE